MNAQLWVESVGGLIVVRLRGHVDEATIRESHARVVQLVKDTGQRMVLYDGLEMESPPNELALVQWHLDEELASRQIRRAIVVPNSRIAYMARLAFAEGDYRVFYNDLAGAVMWLSQEPVAH